MNTAAAMHQTVITCLLPNQSRNLYAMAMAHPDFAMSFEYRHVAQKMRKYRKNVFVYPFRYVSEKVVQISKPLVTAITRVAQRDNGRELQRWNAPQHMRAMPRKIPIMPSNLLHLAPCVF